jgi:hypothetical protein
MTRQLRWYAQSAQEPEVIAVFGEAQLVRSMNRRLEIRGGREAERAQARKWAARFLRFAGGGQWDRAPRRVDVPRDTDSITSSTTIRSGTLNR